MCDGFSVSVIEVPSAEKLRIRAQNRYHFFWVLEGNCLVSWDGTMLCCGQEHVLLMQPGHRIAFERTAKNRPTQIIRLELDEFFLQTLSDTHTDILKSLHFIPFGCAAICTDYPKIMLTKNLAHRLLEVCGEDGFGKQILIRGILSLLLVIVLRVCISADLTKQKETRRVPFLVDQLFAFIKEHLDRPLTLKTLEDAFFFSQEYMSREFKKQTGQTIHQYILHLRLEQSCRCLSQGMPAVHVWRRCGFGSYSYFFQVFKKRYGMTPGEFAEADATNAGMRVDINHANT